MKYRIFCLVLVVCAALLWGCTPPASDSTVSTGSSASTNASTAVTTLPSVTTQPSIPAEREPVLDAPQRNPLPEDFWKDTAFVGDSVSYGLMLESMRTGDLANALFLSTKSMGLYNSLFEGFTHSYQGQSMTTEDALAASGAKKVFIMLGMNDLASFPPEDCASFWAHLTSRIQDKCPDIEIYIQSSTPIYTGAEHGSLTNANMDTYNALLQTFAEDNGFFYIDVASYLKDQTGGIAHRYCSDNYVHLTGEGAQVWIAVLEQFIANQGVSNED